MLKLIREEKTEIL